jgi:hypothetical protein
MPNVSGLLTQKPGSPYGDPAPGDTRNFSVTPTPKREKPNETWNKLKNEKDGYGATYKILKADRLDDYNHTQHGTFHQFSLLLEPLSTPAASNGHQSDAQRSAAIDRAVAFKAAARIIGYQVQAGKVNPEVVVPRAEELTDALLPILRGADPKGPWTEAEGPDPDASENRDGDIPF